MYKNQISRIYDLRLLVRDSWIAAIMMSLIALTIHDSITFQNILLSIAIALGYILAYSVNDYFDAEEDANDIHKSYHNFWVQNNISRKIRFFMFILILSPIFIIFSNYDLKGVLTFSISVMVLWAYSAEPFKLRNFPPFDVITHSLFIISYPYYITVYLLNFAWTKIDILLISALIIGSIVIQLENQIRDYEIDIKKTTNTTIVIGIRRSHMIIKFLSLCLIMVIGYSFSTMNGMIIFLPYALIYLPLILQRLRSEIGEVRSENFIRVIIASMMIYTIGVFVFLIW